MSKPSSTMTMRAAALLMAASVLLSRIIGLLREQYVAWRFGASGETDVYLAAFTLPDLLNYLLAGGALSITFIPIFSKYLADGEEDEGWKVFSIVITFLVVVLGAGILLGEFFAPPLLEGYFSKMPPAQWPELIRLTRIVFPAQLFHFVGAIVTATLFARGQFRAAALAPVLYNLGIIAGGVLLSAPLGIEGMAWGVLFGAFLGPFLIPLLSARGAGLRFRPSLRLSHPGMKTFLWIALPLMIGASLVTVDEWIARRVAAGDPGAITHLNYARKVLLVPVGFLAQAGGVASYPFFARLFAEKKTAELSEAISQASRAILVLSLLVVGLTIPLAEPVIRLLFERGGFQPADTAATAPLLVWFIAGLPAWGLQAIWARGFYAAGDTWRPMILSSLIVVGSYPLFAWFYEWLGAPGLALASSLGISVQALLLWPLLRRHAPELQTFPLLDALWKAGLLAAAGGGAVWAVSRILSADSLGGGTVGLLLLLSLLGFLYGVIAVLGAAWLRVPEVEQLRQKVLRRVRRRRA